MPADCAPRGPRPGEGLGHQILGRVPVTDTHHDGEQAFILGCTVELREVQSLDPHIRSTHNRPTPVTVRLVLQPAPGAARSAAVQINMFGAA